MTERITIDLKDDWNEDNRRFFNLLDDARWKRLIQQAKEGKPLKDLLKELIDGE